MRLDVFLVKIKKIESRAKAQELISQGFVRIKQPGQDEIILTKANYIVDTTIEQFVEIIDNDFSRYVSRGALKLIGALDTTKLDVSQMTVLDVGQSTGGFTDVLLQKGAKFVVGVDVGQDQLHTKIKHDSRVKAFEKINVRELTENTYFNDYIKQMNNAHELAVFDLIVCDVSFISLKKIISQLRPYLKLNGYFILLVKPQFECGPEHLDKNGLVKSSNIYAVIESDIKKECEKAFNCSVKYFSSSITGKDGNKEFFVYGKKCE